MDLERLAKALKIEYNIKPEDVKFLREYYDMGIEEARNCIIEDMILKRIKELVEKVEETSNDEM